MPTNFEIAHGTTIPQFRRVAAKVMATKYHMRQQKISEILGITQAAVSKYVSSRAPITSKIQGKDVKNFIDSAISGDDTSSRAAMCRVCQANRKFDCNFMIKQ